MSTVPAVTVLVYHEILPPGADPAADRGSIQAERFLEHLAALREAGLDALPLTEAFRRLCDEDPGRGQPGFVITFDDAYSGVYEFLAVRPKLCRELRPTIFVITDHVGSDNLGWSTRSAVVLRHMTIAQLSELAGLGAELGSHTTDHHNLLKFDRDGIRLRLERSIDWFVEHFGERPRYLAYPFGYSDREVAETAAEFFDGALSVTHGAWYGAAARHALNRLSVPFFLTGDDLVEILKTPPDRRWLEVEKRAPWRR